jgi:signal transduction histidine kinase
VVLADQLVLRQVLVNLLDNAIKYSHAGGRVSVRVLSMPESLSIAVQDNGPGIPAAHRDRVFDRFYRVDESRSREAGGTGLGLAIAKWGAEVHGGRLELECPAEGGCVFRVVLPAKAPESTIPPVSEQTFRESSANLQSSRSLRPRIT